ncbi:MAG: hypothetical protein K2Q20_12290 [Phycisphaerales bacterium]|nr:hypothetical protein [Phycisphaerales bacterium]
MPDPAEFNLTALPGFLAWTAWPAHVRLGGNARRFRMRRRGALVAIVVCGLVFPLALLACLTLEPSPELLIAVVVAALSGLGLLVSIAWAVMLSRRLRGVFAAMEVARGDYERQTIGLLAQRLGGADAEVMHTQLADGRVLVYSPRGLLLADPRRLTAILRPAEQIREARLSPPRLDGAGRPSTAVDVYFSTPTDPMLSLDFGADQDGAKRFYAVVQAVAACAARLGVDAPMKG